MATAPSATMSPIIRRWARWRNQAAFAAYLFWRNPLSVAGLLIVLFFLAMAALAPWLATHDALAPEPIHQVQPPSRVHYFGTDGLGMDVFSRVVWAARIEMMVAVLSVFLAMLVGIPLGAVAGYVGGWFDNAVMRFLDSQQAFPGYILAMAIVTVLGQSLANIIFVIAF